MIALTNVTARGESARGRVGAMVRNVSTTWDRGVLAIVGTVGDGTSALLAVIAGAIRARTGQVIVGGKSPEDARSEIAHVPLDPTLPDALRVEEVCDLASSIRGEPARPATERLSVLGIEALAKRRVRSLSVGETRAVALAIALTSSAKVLLVEEPLATLEPTAPGRVIEAIRARAAAGTVVVVTTASVRDATRIADRVLVLTAGVLAPLPAALAHANDGVVRLRIVVPSRADGTRGTSALVSALAEDAAIASVETHAFAPSPSDPAGARAASTVIVSGRDLVAVAKSVANAAASARVDVETIESAVAPLETIRAAVAPRPPPVATRPPDATSTAPHPPEAQRAMLRAPEGTTAPGDRPPGGTMTAPHPPEAPREMLRAPEGSASVGSRPPGSTGTVPTPPPPAARIPTPLRPPMPSRPPPLPAPKQDLRTTKAMFSEDHTMAMKDAPARPAVPRATPPPPKPTLERPITPVMPSRPAPMPDKPGDEKK